MRVKSINIGTYIIPKDHLILEYSDGGHNIQYFQGGPVVSFLGGRTNQTKLGIWRLQKIILV